MLKQKQKPKQHLKQQKTTYTKQTKQNQSRLKVKLSPSRQQTDCVHSTASRAHKDTYLENLEETKMTREFKAERSEKLSKN